MKLLFIFGVALLGTIYGSIEEPVPDKSFYESQVKLAELLEEDPYLFRMLEPQIKEKIEEILNELPDPLIKSSVNLDLNLLNSTVNLIWNITDWYMIGGQNYTIDPLTFAIVPEITLNVGVTYHFIHGTGGYSIDGSILQLIPVWGVGDFDTSITEVLFATEVKIVPRQAKYLIVKSISINAKIGDVSLNIVNLFGGDFGDVVQDIINENAPDYLARVLYRFKPDLEGYIVDKVNTLIGNMTIDDLIDWIQGKTTTSPSVTEPVLLDLS